MSMYTLHHACIRIHAYIHTCAHACMYFCIYIYPIPFQPIPRTHARMNTDIQTYMQTYPPTYLHAHVPTYLHMYIIHAYILTCPPTCLPTYTYIIYIYDTTHTRPHAHMLLFTAICLRSLCLRRSQRRLQASVAKTCPRPSRWEDRRLVRSQ